MKRLSTWWRELAGIDLIALGLGFVLTIGFILYKNAFPDQKSPWLDLWPNISTDFLGVWVSVRLIDALIQKRERYHSIRREIISNLNYIRSESLKLLPKIYDFSVKTLAAELMFSQERFPKRKKYLDGGEQRAIEQVNRILEQITILADDYLHLQKQLIGGRFEIRNAFEIINNERERAQEAIEILNQHNPPAQDSAIQADIHLLETYLAAGAIFLPEELEPFRAFLRDYQAQRVNNTQQASSFLANPYFRHISEYKYTAWKTLEESVNMLSDLIDFDYKEFYSLSASTEQHLTSEPVPDYVVPLMRNFIMTANQAVKKHEEIRDTIISLVESIDSARKNLMEELGFD